MKHLFFVIVLLGLFEVCSAQDLFSEQKLFSNTYSKFAIDKKPLLTADTNLIGIWKMKEDTDPHNYFVVERRDNNTLMFTYMNRGGTNRTYEHVSVFSSKIDGNEFMNVSYWDPEHDIQGFFFLKVSERDKDGWHMTLSLVDDATLKNLTSNNAVKEQIQKNSHNALYYKKEVHLRKLLPLKFCK
jgi:hypothetical protein